MIVDMEGLVMKRDYTGPKIMNIGGKKEQTGLDRCFQDIAGKVNNRASRLVYTG